MFSRLSTVLFMCSIVTIISLGMIVKHLNNKLTTTENDLQLSLDRNKQLVNDLVSLRSRYNIELQKLSESNKEILDLKSKKERVISYANSSKDTTVDTFNNVVDRLWSENSSDNSNKGNN